MVCLVLHLRLCLVVNPQIRPRKKRLKNPSRLLLLLLPLLP